MDTPTLFICKLHGEIYISMLLSKGEVLDSIDLIIANNLPIHTITEPITTPGKVVVASTVPDGWLIFIQDNKDVTQELLREGEQYHNEKWHKGKAL